MGIPPRAVIIAQDGETTRKEMHPQPGQPVHYRKLLTPYPESIYWPMLLQTRRVGQ